MDCGLVHRVLRIPSGVEVCIAPVAVVRESRFDVNAPRVLWDLQGCMQGQGTRKGFAQEASVLGSINLERYRVGLEKSVSRVYHSIPRAQTLEGEGTARQCTLQRMTI